MNFLRNIFLWPISKCFEWLSWLYHFAWDHGVFKSQTASIPVISIGNIAIGGIGKTPLTIYLATELSSYKIPIAIASRGYLSKWENSPKSKLVSPATTSAKECGDEPLLISKKCPGVPVLITKHRIQSANVATSQKKELLLLDDGMQHRKLKKNYEIVLVNAEDPLGENAFFPLGKLRDRPQRLSVANLIVIMNCKNETGYKRAKAAIKKYTLSPTVGFASKIHPPKARKAAVITAIANPERFLEALQKQGIEIVLTCTLRDHAFFEKSQLESFAKKALEKGAEMVLCTEKDHVKIETPLKSTLLIVSVPHEVFPIYDKENWENAIKQMIEIKNFKKGHLEFFSHGNN